jgi:phosphate transport system permease protein
MSKTDENKLRQRAKLTDVVMKYIFTAVTFAIFLLILTFFFYILYLGREKFNFSFIFGTDSSGFMGAPVGIGTQLFNSIYMVFLSMLITIPVGLGAGIYLAKYARQGRIKNIIRLCIETLASIPSIVIGLFGFLLFVQIFKFGYSILSGALALSVLNIPYMTRLSEDAINSVDKSIEEGSLGIGATKFQTIIHVIIPSALSGIITGILLATGRALGEAATLIYTAGMSSSKLNFSHINPFDAQSPFNIFRSAETLSVFIWKVNSESLMQDPEKVANSAAAVLLIIVLLFNVFSKVIEKRLNKKYRGE